MTEFDEKMLEGIKAAVWRFLRSNPQFGHLRDDMTSGCYIGLMKGLKAFDARKGVTLASFLRIVYERCIWDVVRSENVIQTPRKNFAKRVGMSAWSDTKAATGFESLRDASANALANAYDACKDETDYLVLALLLTHRTIKQIAVELEIPIRKVRERKKEIGLRMRATE